VTTVRLEKDSLGNYDKDSGRAESTRVHSSLQTKHEDMIHKGNECHLK